MTRIMFVCTGNICRSPLAHAVFEDLVHRAGRQGEFEVESSGTTAYHVGEPADARMRKTARQHGVDINHRARHFSAYDFEEYDLILAMDNQNLANIKRQAPDSTAANKVRLFRDFDPAAQPGSEVPDPYYGGAEGFERVYTMVERTCRELLAALNGKGQ